MIISFFFYLLMGLGLKIIVFFFSSILKLIFVLLSIAFVTLFERKVLGFSQNRLGPNKLLLKGVLQPVIDGVKLLIKELFFPKKIIFWAILLGPFLGFLVMLFLWRALLRLWKYKIRFYLILFVVVFIGLRVYSTLISGWRRTSKFASIGRVRSCSQSISYEISLVFFIIRFLIFYSSFREINFGLFPFILFFSFWLRCVAETNRAPFDFREGERELISGFNLEFGSAGFVLLFLAEYGIILFFRGLMRMFFFGINIIVFLIIMFIFIFIRRVYPRFRYDILINITWTKFLPFSLILVWFFIMVL